MNEKIEELKNKALGLPMLPGVYIMKNRNLEIIYIGKAKKLKNRVVSYFRGINNHTPKVAKMVSNVDSFDYIVCNTEFEALLTECSLIKQYKPKYNILLKDDKGYNYIKITSEDYPRLVPVLQKYNDKDRYIGPYLSSYAIKTAVEDTAKIFMLPTCKRNFPADIGKGRPCLNYYIKRCMGVCRGNISQEEYKGYIEEAVKYLTGGNENDIAGIEKEMMTAADNLDFERAAKLRDRIEAIKKINATQKVVYGERVNCDGISAVTVNEDVSICIIKIRCGRISDKVNYIFKGEAEEEVLSRVTAEHYLNGGEIPAKIYLSRSIEDIKQLEELLMQKSKQNLRIITPVSGTGKDLLKIAEENALEYISQKRARNHKELNGLKSLCSLLGVNKGEYIESYDISNLGSQIVVGGMVVFVDGRPEKKRYKRFNIKDILVQNDVMSMAQVIKRRFERYFDTQETDKGFKTLPDIILLDGGEGQLRAVTQVLNDMGVQVPVFGMVKDNRHKTKTIMSTHGEIVLWKNREAFNLVSRIQEEVHRYSVAYEKSRHKNIVFDLKITQIEGVGKVRAERIFKAYKTKKSLMAATAEELSDRCGVPINISRKIVEYLKKDGL